MDPVLIVDDEPAVLRLVQRLLDKHGIRSQTAPGAVEAVALLSQQDFSAILLDYYLEDGPSWPVLEAARSSPVGPPVIMMTAQGEEWLAAEAVQRGAADFRIKSDLFWKELPGIVQRAARQAEADHAQALLASIVESSGDAIVGLTAQGLILSWNGAAEKMFGHNQAEALGRALSDFVIPESGSELEQVLAGACCTSDCLEAQGVLPGGERLDLSLTVSRIRARTGKASACAIARDVSPQKQAQRQLQVRLEQRAAVAELGRQALQGCQTQQLLEQAVALAAEALGVEFAEILERVPDPEDAPEGHPFQPSAFQGRLKRRSGCGWTGDDPDAPIDESRGWFTLGCRQPVLSQDLSAETRFEPSAALRRHRAASGLSVVIEAAPDPFGVFGVYSSSPRRFTPDDSNFLQSLANVLGSAIQRVRTQEASLERNRLMAFEAEVFRALSQHVDAAALLSACLAAMVTHLGARLARAWLLDRGQDVLQLAATAGNHTQTEVGYQRIPVGQYKVGRIAQTGRPELSNSFLTDSDVAFPEWAARDQIVGFAGHPLIVEGRVEGVLAMFSSQPLSPSLSTVLQSVADGIAQALARLRSQAALRQSKQRLDLLVRQSPLAVIEWTVGGEVSAWNPAAEAIFGNTPEEALGLKWTDLIPHDHVQRLRARWEDVTRKAQHSIHDHVTRSGAIISCEWFSAPLVEDGQVVGIASLCRDCTETSRADEELRKLRHALEQSPVAVMLTDGQGSIEYVNPRFVEMSGYSASEALGQKPSLAKSGFHPPEFYKQLWSTILSGRVFHGEMCNRRKNGEVYWQKAVIAPVRDGQGRITSFIAFQEEMTGRKLIESQLAASEEKFKGIFDSMQDGYVTADIAGFLTLVNPAAVRLFGYRDAAELLAVPCRELFADKQERNALLGTMLELGQRADQRGTIRRKDGTLRIFEGSSRTQPGPDGQPRSVEALFRDVTERSQAEADRQARQAADVANRLKSQFLAHMSHEIRTPLHAILGMTHLALGTQLNERQRHYLEHIQRGGRALLAIVNDILDFSKVEAGKLQLELVEFGLDEVIENLVSVLAGKADEKGLEFIVRVAPEVPAHLLGDPMRLGQVLINLVGNAIKFTQSGEVILSIGLDPGPGGSVPLRFEIRDTGVGLSAEQIEGLFASFAQADNSITRKYGGTGLGLAICQQLIHLMQGEIRVQSLPGEGSTFTFTALFEAGQPREGQRLPDLSDLRALVVEDSPASLEILSSALRRLSVRVTAQSTAEDALAEVERARHPYDLIFVGFHMPGRLDSLETIRRLRAADLPNTLIVLVAGHGEDSVAQRASAAGVNSVLFKPFTLSHLLDIILNLLDRPELKRWRLEPVPAELPGEIMEGIRGARVLVVEDNAINQEIARELLRSAGLEVDVVSDGSQAVERILGCGGRRCPWQAVLMDLQMPKMDGYTATAAIRADHRFRLLPILAVTAHVLPEERQRCYAAGMDDYISKPIDPRSLFTVLHRWISIQDTDLPVSAYFPGISGVDTVNGLSRVAGNGALYRSLLLELARQREETSDALQAAAPDGEQLARLAHALRGVAGNLGVLELASQAAELERQARAGQIAPAAECLARLLDTLAEADGFIRAALEDWQPQAESQEVLVAASEPGQSDTARAALARLETLLETSDGSAVDAWQEVRKLIEPRAQPAQLDRLGRLVHRFEFVQALAELRSLSPDLDGPGADGRWQTVDGRR